MKKSIIIIMTLFVLFATGCKEKNLICKKENIFSENVASYVINANFKNDKVNNMRFEIETNVAEKYIEYLDILEKELLENYVYYQNKEGIKLNTSKNNNIITLDINIEFNKLNEELKKDLGISENSSYRNAKKSLESSGFVCN